jgi:hypothetical protein
MFIREVIIVETTSRSGRITVDLLEYKQRWLAHCKAQGTTPSEAFRLVVAKLTARDEEAEQGASKRLGADKKIRKEVRLTFAECQSAETLAAEEGFSLTRWIASLVRARVHGGAQLGQVELELLARSNMQILALGRTLNQLARAANANPDALRAYQAKQIAQTAALVKEHAAVVAGVIKANVERWSTP